MLNWTKSSIRAPAAQRTSKRALNARSRIIGRSTELDEIDPITGEVISKAAQALRSPMPTEFINAGGFKWGIRTAEVNADKKPSTNTKAKVIMLHGIGSSSYCYRELVPLMAEEGFDCIAVDWIGCGGSDKPEEGSSAFDYSQEAYVSALDALVAEVSSGDEPIILIAHGFILGNYAMRWALEKEKKIEKMVLLNMPLSPSKSKLPPTLAAYKSPIAFMRPKVGSSFPADQWNADGLAYIMKSDVADAYLEPYVQDQAASEAVRLTCDQCDFKEMLKGLDIEYETFKTESLLLFGNSDRNISLAEPISWLESKRTSMRIITLEDKLGHIPMEDYAEPVSEALATWLRGEQVVLSTGIGKGTKERASRNIYTRNQYCFTDRSNGMENYEKGLKPGEISTGTTIMSASFHGGVILAADSRTSSGNYVANRATDKITQLAKNVWICRSGSAADTQNISMAIQSQLEMHALETNRMTPVKVAANLVRSIAYENKDRLMAGMIVAGWDEKLGGQLYAIPLGGTMLRAPYSIGGSGSAYITGWCDKYWKDGMTKEECREFCIRAVAHAISRDGSSGGCIRLVIIDKDGAQREFIPGEHVPPVGDGDMKAPNSIPVLGA